MYFNVLANGIPYLLGTERLKGSHSMSGYHSAELRDLSTVYMLLATCCSPTGSFTSPGGERLLLDALPAGRVKLDWVEVGAARNGAFLMRALPAGPCPTD